MTVHKVEEIAMELLADYHVKILNLNTISVITSYKAQLEAIAKKHDIILQNVYDQRLTVQGVFTLTDV